MDTIRVEDIVKCKGKPVAIDIESNGLHWWRNEIIGVGIHCPQAGVSGYIHTCKYEHQPHGKPKKKKLWMGDMDYSKSKRGRKVYVEVEEQPTRRVAIPYMPAIIRVSQAINEIASHPKTVLIGHNLKFDAHFLRLPLAVIDAKIVDTTVMVHLYDSRLPKNMGVAEITFLHNRSKRQHVAKADPKLKNSVWLWEPDVVADYCTNDCVVTYQLAETLMPLLDELKLTKLFWMQMKYLRLLHQIERIGTKIDPDYCRESIIKLNRNLAAMEKEFFDAIGHEINWRSPAQLSKAIYDGLGIEKPTNPFAGEISMSRTRFRAASQYNQYCTSSGLLVDQADHPLAPLILDMRETDKLKSYLEKYLELIDEQHTIHTSFRLTGTRTGRLSSAEPNLQNMPSPNRRRESESSYTGGSSRTDAYNIRQAMVARKGYKLVSMDHKQQELRLLGILSQDQNLLEAIRERKDLHMEVAMMVWGDCGEERNALHRDWSKAISFGLIYGMGTESLMYKLGLTLEETEVILEQYWSRFPDVRPWIAARERECAEKGYVRYWSGRIWRESDPADYYKGANAVIQGGSADLMSIALLRLNKLLVAKDWGRIVSIVHDEILMEVQEGKVEEVLPELLRTMEVEDLFGVPFFADAKIGDSYGTLEKYVPMEKEVA